MDRAAAHARGLIALYINDRLAKREIVLSSAETITSVLRHWARTVDHAPPDRWTCDQVTAWVYDEAVRASTMKSRATKLRPYVRWLIRHGHLDRDPCEHIGRIHVPPGDPRDLEPSEVGLLLSVCPDDRARLIVGLMAQLGLRCGDVARIRIEDIDVRRRRLHVRAKGGRGAVTHPEPITQEAWETLEPWLCGLGRRTGPLIESYQRPGRALQPGTISKLVGEWITTAGLKTFPYDGISAHALRHSTAQHMLDNGADMRAVQHALGHKSLRTTEGYARREPAGLREAMEGRRYVA
jgi:integrase